MATRSSGSSREKSTAKRPAKRRGAAGSTGSDTSGEEIVVRPGEDLPRSTGSVFFRGTVRHSDVTVFLRQLIMLLEAGTSILKALKSLAGRGNRQATRALIADIAAYVEQGNPLWQAFDRHPRYFDSVFVNLIRASEASGTLVPVLRRSVEYRERRAALAKRVKAALIYPVVLVAACFAVLFLIVTVVIPVFRDLFDQAGLAEEIPWYTEALFAASEWFLWVVPIAFVVFLAVVVLYKLWVRNPLARLRADRVKISLPIVGKIIHKNALVEFTRTMALLLRSGLSMMASLDLTRKAIHNRAVGQSLQAVRDSVERGEGLEPPLRENEGVIPPVVADMIVTGEESGRVDLVCDQIADTYEEEVEIHVVTLGETLLPVFIVVIGATVLILILAIFAPLLSMMDALAGSGI